MQKVVSISLNGIAYQLEEPGYDRLHSYLLRAEQRLADSPDRSEIMTDLEQAIGEKCARMLNPHKTVVSAIEVDRIIEEMGPVENPDDKAAADAAQAQAVPGEQARAATEPPRKRLYQLREGAMISGVCNGIAAYINVDVTWVRLAFVLLTIFTSGFWILLYIALAFIVPVAESGEERAAAFGMPFNAAELIDRAKKNAEKFGGNYRWRREWRRQQRAWHKQWQHMNEQLRHATAQAAPQVSYAARAMAGILVPLAAVIGAVIFVVWILAMLSLFTQHHVFGWDLPANIPLWGAMLGLVVGYLLISAPFKALRDSGGSYGERPFWRAAHSLMWIGFVAVFFWMAYQFIPPVREMMDQFGWAANLAATTISETIT